jgi:hypothetical protein
MVRIGGYWPAEKSNGMFLGATHASAAADVLHGTPNSQSLNHL